MKRNSKYDNLRVGIMGLWVIAFFFYVILTPTPPEGQATPAQTIATLIVMCSILPIFLIMIKFFPTIELPKNKILAYNFYWLGINLEEYNTRSEEYRIIEIPEINRSLKSCGDELTSALTELPDFWAGDMESSLESLRSAIYKINRTIKKQEIIDEKLLKEISNLSKTLYDEKNLSQSLNRRITTIDSLLKKTEEEPIRISILSRFLKSIVTFPQWWRTRSIGVRFFINCVIIVPIFCLGGYLITLLVFPGVSTDVIYVGIMALAAAGLYVSASLSK